MEKNLETPAENPNCAPSPPPAPTANHVSEAIPAAPGRTSSPLPPAAAA